MHTRYSRRSWRLNFLNHTRAPEKSLLRFHGAAKEQSRDSGEISTTKTTRRTMGEQESSSTPLLNVVHPLDSYRGNGVEDEMHATLKRPLGIASDRMPISSIARQREQSLPISVAQLRAHGDRSSLNQNPRIHPIAVSVHPRFTIRPNSHARKMTRTTRLLYSRKKGNPRSLSNRRLIERNA